MNSGSAPISSCRHCQYYSPEGRRGGQCHKLSVAVKGHWDACSVAVAPFKPSWQDFGDIMVWQRKGLLQEVNAVVEQTEPEPVAVMIETPQPVTRSLAVSPGSGWSS